jgi:hypothetical protein
MWWCAQSIGCPRGAGPGPDRGQTTPMCNICSTGVKHGARWPAPLCQPIKAHTIGPKTGAGAFPSGFWACLGIGPQRGIWARGGGFDFAFRYAKSKRGARRRRLRATPPLAAAARPNSADISPVREWKLRAEQHPWVHVGCRIGPF